MDDPTPGEQTPHPHARLEELTPGARLRGLTVDGPITVIDATWHGDNAITLTYRGDDGHVDQALLYRDMEPSLRLEQASRAYAFDADPHLFRLAAEAQRIRMAALFDPMLAVTTSDLEPLPHQIKAVYGELLPRTPLRFLLADDPGAGKTIMAGLYIRSSCCAVTSSAASSSPRVRSSSSGRRSSPTSSGCVSSC